MRETYKTDVGTEQDSLMASSTNPDGSALANQASIALQRKKTKIEQVAREEVSTDIVFIVALS